MTKSKARTKSSKPTRTLRTTTSRSGSQIYVRPGSSEETLRTARRAAGATRTPRQYVGTFTDTVSEGSRQRVRDSGYSRSSRRPRGGK